MKELGPKTRDPVDERVSTRTEGITPEPDCTNRGDEWGDGHHAKKVVALLPTAADAEEIVVRINSYGASCGTARPIRCAEGSSGECPCED